MGRVAVGRYLGILLQERGISPGEAADKLKISVKTLNRWLAGKHAGPYDQFFELVALVDGSLAQIDTLLRDARDAPADGIRAAAERLDRRPEARLRALAREIPTAADLEGLIAAWGDLHATGDEAR